MRLSGGKGFQARMSDGKVHGLPGGELPEGSLGEIPKENSSLKVKQNCLLPAHN